MFLQNSLDSNYGLNYGDSNLENMFDCNYCKKKFTLEINLKIHLDEEHREQVQVKYLFGYCRCLVLINYYCLFLFLQNSLNYNCVLNDDTNLEKTLDCKENFALKIDLKNHVGKHTDQIQVRYTFYYYSFYKK